MDLPAILKEKREHLSASSIKTYSSILKNLYRRCYKDDEMTIEKFNDDRCVLEHLKDIPYNKRKSVLSALVVLTGNDKYRELMMRDVGEYNENLMKQERTGKFAENMIPFEDVEAIVKKHMKDANALYRDGRVDMASLQKIQNYVLLCCCSGVYQAPRRSADWNMKFRNYDAENDNYCDIKKKVFVFNVFKTKKDKGTQTIPIEAPLLKILKKWISVIPEDCDYIFFDTKKQGLIPSQITHRLNGVFGKNVSTSMLRHIYLTHKFGNVNLQDLNETSNAMGNSPMMALGYVKR
jgi:hypothetical protein